MDNSADVLEEVGTANMSSTPVFDGSALNIVVCLFIVLYEYVLCSVLSVLEIAVSVDFPLSLAIQYSVSSHKSYFVCPMKYFDSVSERKAISPLPERKLF